MNINEPSKDANFKKLVEKVISSGNKNRPMKYVMWGLAIFNAGDFGNSPNLAVMVKAFRILGKGWRGVKAIKDVVESMNEIDDRLDELPPEAILALGKAVIGKSPSEFLYNRNAVTEKDVNIGRVAIELGLCSINEGVSMANLAGVIIQDGAKKAIDYNNTKSVQARNEYAQENIKFGTLSAMAIVHVFKRNKGIERFVNNGVDFEVMRMLYPKTNAIGKLGQIHDDFHDLFTDLKSEVDSGSPSPNYLLAKMHEKGQLLNSRGEINRSLKIFIEQNKNKPDVPYSAFPASMKDVIHNSKLDFARGAGLLSSEVRDFLLAAWDVTASVGSKNESYEKPIEHKDQTMHR